VVSAEQARAKYDALVDRYEELFFYVADVGRRLAEYADPPPGARLLDVGAGRGAVARAALARGCVVTAVDASPAMMGRLRSEHPAIDALEMDANRLEFTAASFDVVTAGFVVQVLDRPDLALAEMRRVLVPGGVVGLSLETQSAGPLDWLQDLHAEFFGGRPADAPVEPDPAGVDDGPMTADRLDALLRRAGFVDLARTAVEMPLALDDPPALWAWLARQGLGDALRALPAERADQFRARVLTHGQRWHDDGGIVIPFAATLHRARSPR
jgi:SAM-dependent methyltransferase